MSVLDESILLVGGSVGASVIGLIMVRRTFRRHDFKKHHEIAGYFISVVGTLYSILLGLIVVNVQSKFDESKMMAQAEASSCSDVANICRGLPRADAVKIRSYLQWYYTVVQQENWEKIADGSTSEQSIPPYQGLWNAISALEPQTNKQTACFSSLLDSMKRLSDARRYRMSARKRGLSIIVWIVLCVGAVLIILFTYFFWVESASTQLLLTVFVALFVSLNLLLVRLFENPYRNELLIKKGAFYFKPAVLGSSPEKVEAGKADNNGKDSRENHDEKGPNQQGHSLDHADPDAPQNKAILIKSAQPEQPGQSEEPLQAAPDPLVK